MEYSPATFPEKAEARRQILGRLFGKRRHRKGERMSKESIILAYHNLHDYEKFPFGRPANVLSPEFICKIAKVVKDEDKKR